MGVTNLVERATATAAELSRAELRDGARRLEAEVADYRPAWLAVLGVTAYRTAFERPKAVVGRQPERVGGAQVWVLPNPSGLNSHYTPAGLAELFTELRQGAGFRPAGRPRQA